MADIELAKKLYDELNRLGSADEIAETLRVQGVKAHRGTTTKCAIFAYLNQRTESYAMTRGNSICIIGGYLPVLMHSPAMRTFIAKFDLCDYPFLLADCEVCQNPNSTNVELVDHE